MTEQTNGMSPTTKWVIGIMFTVILAGNSVLFSYVSRAHAQIDSIKESYVPYRDLELLRGDLERFKHEIRADIKANTRELHELKGMLPGMR